MRGLGSHRVDTRHVLVGGVTREIRDPPIARVSGTVRSGWQWLGHTACGGGALHDGLAGINYTDRVPMFDIG